MNIGIITTWFERGAAYVSRQYLQSLEAQGHTVFIYARGGECQPKDDPNWAGERVHIGKAPRGQLNAKPVHRQDFINWLSQHAIDWAIFNEQQWWPPVIWARKAGVKTAAYIDYYRQDSVALFGLYDLLLCHTQRHHSVFDWHPQCHYIPWGTDTALFSPAKPTVRSGQTTAVRTLFVSAGYSPRRKGVDTLLRVFQRLDTPHARLLIHSQAPLEQSLPELSECIATLKQQQRLSVITETKAAPGYYHLGDLYLYLSRLDGIGLSLPEALACGLPAVIPDEAPMNEFVQAGINGFTVNISHRATRADDYYWPECFVDENDLARVLTHCLSLTTSELDALKAQSRAHARQSLDWPARASALANAFETSRALAVSPELINAGHRYFWQRLWQRDKWTLIRRADRYAKQWFKRLSPRLG